MTTESTRGRASVRAFRSLAILSSTLIVSQSVFGIDINPGAVTINQIDFRLGPNSVVGEFSIDYAAAGSSGFVNVLHPNITGDSGWLVRNLPVFSGLTPYNHGSITTRMDLSLFSLGNGNDVGPTPFIIDYDPLPSTSYADVLSNGATPSLFDIGDVNNATGGGGGTGSSVIGYHAAPNLIGVTFNPLGIPLVDFRYQPGHPNEQAGDDQCAPMAMANSLQWLEDTNPGFEIPHDHQPGWGGDPLDESLVAELDRAMGRTMGSDRGDALGNEGVWPMDGKLQYLDDNDLEGRVSVKFMTNGIATSSGSAPLDGDDDYTHAGITATGHGDEFDIDWILGELEAGEDVEIDLYYQPDPPNGRHYVQVVGGGRILGMPFLLHSSDKEQNSYREDDPLTAEDESFDFDPFDLFGTDDIDFEWIDPDTGLAFNSNAIIDQVISESVIPEPISTGALLGLAVIALRRRSN